MEKQLFTWQKWDKVDQFILGFDGIVLIRDIGKLKAGTKFDEAIVDFENGDLQLTNFETNSKKREVLEQHNFKLVLEVEQCE